MGNLMSIFFPKAAAPAPLEQVATQGGEPNVVRLNTLYIHPFSLPSLSSKVFVIAAVVNVKKERFQLIWDPLQILGVFDKHTFNGGEGGDFEMLR